jgi:Ca-activated chloride channel family protein
MRLNRYVSFLLMLLMVAVSVHGQKAARNMTATGPTDTLRVDVDLVVVNATVTDPENRIVSGLKPENFKIWEDKVEQNIEFFSSEEVPLSVGIIFDVSGSMKDKLSAARDAAVTFLQTGTPEDEYFLVEFSDRPKLARDFTTEISKLRNQITSSSAGGLTAMYDAVYFALDKVRKGTNSKKALLLITDGEDNRSRYNFSNLKAFAKEQDVQIYSIGISSRWSVLRDAMTWPSIGRDLIEQLSDLTGGRAFFPDSVDELEGICEKIAIELKSQYVLGYRSTNQARDGKWRKLLVKVRPPAGMPNLNIRAKTGYYAAQVGAGANRKTQNSSNGSTATR